MNLVLFLTVFINIFLVLAYLSFYIPYNYPRITSKLLGLEWVLIYRENSGKIHKAYRDEQNNIYYIGLGNELYRLYEDGTCDPKTPLVKGKVSNIVLQDEFIPTWTPLTSKIAKFYKKND